MTDEPGELCVHFSLKEGTRPRNSSEPLQGLFWGVWLPLECSQCTTNVANRAEFTKIVRKGPSVKTPEFSCLPDTKASWTRDGLIKDVRLPGNRGPHKRAGQQLPTPRSLLFTFLPDRQIPVSPREHTSPLISQGFRVMSQRYCSYTHTFINASYKVSILLDCAYFFSVPSSVGS